MMIAMLLAAAPLPPAADAQHAVEAALADSAAGWNRGDVPRFLALYADDAVFVTRQGLVRGRAAIAARYDRGYGKDPAKRGQLSFRLLGQRAIDPAHRMLWARWTLTYPGGRRQSGMTSLVFERRGAAWKVVADHSS